MPLNTFANCYCTHDPYQGGSKEYQKLQKKWWGYTREWTCKYTCYNGQIEAQVKGSYKDSAMTDDGRLGICEGTIYKEHYNAAGPIFWVYMLDGAEDINPRKANAKELKAWAQANCN